MKGPDSGIDDFGFTLPTQRSISFPQFSLEFEEYGRSRNIPLRDILNWKEDIYVMARRHESITGSLLQGEEYLFTLFDGFKKKFAEPLPVGSRPVTGQLSDSE